VPVIGMVARCTTNTAKPIGSAATSCKNELIKCRSERSS
jgi:hypothetical protein